MVQMIAAEQSNASWKVTKCYKVKLKKYEYYTVLLLF
jgi:hypothetical protein